MAPLHVGVNKSRALPLDVFAGTREVERAGVPWQHVLLLIPCLLLAVWLWQSSLEQTCALTPRLQQRLQKWESGSRHPCLLTVQTSSLIAQASSPPCRSAPPSDLTLHLGCQVAIGNQAAFCTQGGVICRHQCHVEAWPQCLSRH